MLQTITGHCYSAPVVFWCLRTVESIFEYILGRSVPGNVPLAPKKTSSSPLIYSLWRRSRHMSSVASQMWVVVLCFMSINIIRTFARCRDERNSGVEMGQNYCRGRKAVPVWNFSPLCDCLLYITKAPSAIEKCECFSHLHNTAPLLFGV